MRILFASGANWLPEATGGTQYSTDYFIRRCMPEGHKCAVYSALSGRGFFGARLRLKRKALRQPFTVDRSQGYEVMRSWNPPEPRDVEAAVNRFRPDVVVIQSLRSGALGHAFAKLGIPVVIYLRNVEFDELEGDLATIPNAKFIANSRFTSDRYEEAFGIKSSVIMPTIEVDKYKYETTREFATLINIHPHKGFEVARNVAEACPEIPFLFVEAWTLWDTLFEEIKPQIDALPNVTFKRRTSNMEEVYGRTKVLLAPSQWEEAWGRVASEAHCSGIPVLGSDRGGLPQAIGPGGIVLPYDAPTDDWVNALKSLWANDRVYAEASAAALDYANRADLDPAQQYQTFISIVQNAAKAKVSELV